MSRLMKGEIKTAVRTLQHNKGRSLLTMLGIIIGVTSVLVVVGIGEGVRQQIGAQTDRLGKDLITIRPGQLLGQVSSGSMLNGLGPVFGQGLGGSLSDIDIKTVQKTPGVATAVPLSIVSSGVVSGENNHRNNALVIGTTPGMPDMLKQSLAFGTFFNDTSTDANKVVIGSHVAQVLYDENVPLGQTLTILGHQFIVVGIFNDFQTTPLSLDADFNNAVFIPYTVARQITNDSTPIYEILARPSQVSQTDVVAGRVNGSLLAAHGGQHDFTVLEQSQTLAVTNTILSLLTSLIAGVAAISLLVGGIGIMNVMLVSVTERMHEIGIRKAIGATNQQILRQFMVEAIVLSVVGSALGVMIAFSAELVLRIFTNLAPSITWQIVAIACGVSIGVGVLFGSIPALKAARKDPISALRNE